jgi:uncharacterized membrane protein YkoI
MLKTFTTALCLAVAVTAGAQTKAKTTTTSAAKTMPAATKAAPAAARPAQASVKTAAKTESQATLRKEAKINMTTARATALKEVPNGRVSKSELEREGGKLIYSFDIRVAGKSGIEEVNVDAVTGAVVSHEHETAKTEAKEKKAEKK